MDPTSRVLTEAQVARLRQALVRRGWPDSELARRADLTTTTVWRIMRREPVAARSIGKILTALEANPPAEDRDGIFQAAS